MECIYNKNWLLYIGLKHATLFVFLKTKKINKNNLEMKFCIHEFQIVTSIKEPFNLKS